jgi:alkanesulfonate monooxygenase SsuD/methylene tetrahydromethanopterin reductase-like flavin-dependent oxidoreductase (luciferase family)
MRVGVTLFAQNYQDWDRFLAQERGEGVPGSAAVADADIWRDELALADLVEPLGYDSLWTIEHHFTPYTMITNPLQFLSYAAGRTQRIDMGTMVVVLPWHNPIRVAEDATMLQNLLGPDRKLTLGFGRGAGRREFGGIGVPMGESRQRFLESLEVLRLAIGQDRFSYDGEFYSYPELSLRPKPRDASLLDDLYCAWGSPQTATIAGEAGLKPLIIPQKAWDDYAPEMEAYAAARAARGDAPAKPIIVVWAYVADTEAEAHAAATRYMTEYADSAMRHYELASDHFATTSGYEHYAAMAQVLDGSAQAMGQVWVDNHVWGTPEQCVEKIRRINDKVDPAELVIVGRYGSMPVDEAEANLRLFARDVLPAVHELTSAPAGSPG